MKRWSFFLRMMGSVLLLFYVFQKVGWEAVKVEISQANPYYLTLYFFSGIFTMIVSSVRWSLLTNSQGITASIPRLFMFVLVGKFFNNILPTSVGGDVVRAYELGKFEGKKNEAMASVFVERFAGLTTLMFFSLFAVIMERRFLGETKIALCLLFSIAFYLSIILIVLNRSLLLFFQKKVRIKWLEKVLHKVSQVQEAVLMYKHQKRALTIAMVWTILFYLALILNVYIGCLSFDNPVPFSRLLLAVPLMLLIFMIPLSIGGIGIQEWAYFFILSLIGVPPSIGLSLGLVSRARVIIYGLMGGAVYPFLGK